MICLAPCKNICKSAHLRIVFIFLLDLLDELALCHQSLILFSDAFLKFLRFLLLSFEFGHKDRNATPSSWLALDVLEAILVSHEPFGHRNQFISALLLDKFTLGKIVDVEEAMLGFESGNQIQHVLRVLAVLEHLFGSCKHWFMPFSCFVVGVCMGHDY